MKRIKASNFPSILTIPIGIFNIMWVVSQLISSILWGLTPISNLIIWIFGLRMSVNRYCTNSVWYREYYIQKVAPWDKTPPRWENKGYSIRTVEDYF